MGMSASQARLLAITSRMNDIELKSQQVANIKLRLADESEQVAQDYTKALNKTKITVQKWQDNQIKMVDLNSGNIKSSGFALRANNGNNVPTTYTAAQLYEMIESGEFYLEKDGAEVSVSGNTQLGITSDDTELARAEADYNAKTLKINNKEKKLDMEMKALDTEHNALKTEQESVKSLIGDNVSKSFNIFS